MRSFFMSMRVPLFKSQGHSHESPDSSPPCASEVQQVLHPFLKYVFLWLDVNAHGYKNFCTSCCTLALTLQLESMERQSGV